MAPSVKHYFTREISTNPLVKFREKCNFCGKSWTGINESQMRVHLSDITTTNEKSSKIPLCTSAPEDVLELFSNHFADARKVI